MCQDASTVWKMSPICHDLVATLALVSTVHYMYAIWIKPVFLISQMLIYPSLPCLPGLNLLQPPLSTGPNLFQSPLSTRPQFTPVSPVYQAPIFQSPLSTRPQFSAISPVCQPQFTPVSPACQTPIYPSLPYLPGPKLFQSPLSTRPQFISVSHVYQAPI